MAALGDEYTILVVAQAAQVQGCPDAATALNAAFGDEQPFADMPEDAEEVAYFATLSDALSGIGGGSGDVRLTRCSVSGKSDYTANAAGTTSAPGRCTATNESYAAKCPLNRILCRAV